jgi:lysyl-tRNA synthetase class 2
VRAIALPVFGALGALTLARGLSGRRRLAWWIGAVVLLIALLSTIRVHPWRVTGFGALLVLLLVLVRGRWPNTAESRQVRLAAAAALALLGVGLARRDTAVLVLALGVVGVLVVALAPAPAPAPGTPGQRTAVRTLANHEDADSLSPFASRQDKSYVFSPDGRAAIGYRVKLGTALVGGDPVGSLEETSAAMAAFLELCRQRGWRPAVLGATDQAAQLWREHRLRGIVIGDEAVLDVESFSLESRRMRNVRQAVSRTRRAGVSVTFGPPGPELERELRPVLDHWLAGRAMRGFSMNLDQVFADRPDTLIGTARTADGEPVAFARFARCAGGQTLTLDIAPRRRDAPNGVVERLIVEAVEVARSEGVREVSLNFAALRRVFESDAALSRITAGITHIADPWIGINSLYRFCAKFNPQWRQRSLMMPSWLSIGAVGAAAILTELRPNRPPATPGARRPMAGARRRR